MTEYTIGLEWTVVAAGHVGVGKLITSVVVCEVREVEGH